MSHHPRHNWGGWDYERVTNVAGVVEVIAVQRCTWPGCGAVNYGGGAEAAPSEHSLEWRRAVDFARTLEAGSEPDD